MKDKPPIIDKDLIRELADLLTETGLTEIEVGQGDTRVRVARAPTPATVSVPLPAYAAPARPPIEMPESPAEPPDLQASPPRREHRSLRFLPLPGAWPESIASHGACPQIGSAGRG